MQNPRIGLKTRFVAACLLLVSISTAGYYWAVSQFIEFLEAELRDITLLGELDEFVRAYERDPMVSGPHAAGISSYVLPLGADPRNLPPALREMHAGAHDDIRIDGREVAVAREDVKGARLYVVFDMEGVEALEKRFVNLAWLCALISWTAAVALALWLAQRVLQPVSRLAERVGRFQPGDYRQRLSPDFDDPEIGQIAHAFDRFMERMEAFVSREQAFTEDASHELRTPLTVIDSAAQILDEDQTLSASGRERVQRILRAVEQMKMLIEALLFLAREEGGHTSEDLALHELVPEIVEHHREMIAGKRLEVAVHAVPTRLHAPRGMASSVIGNLLINAIHYTEHGRIDIKIEPGRLLVQDTGVGIPPEDLERIFERRFRGAQSRGLGLGLYLVKRICERLGWVIRVSSAAGTGTRFEVSFPSA
jgi:signal transduction histidine kinase